MSIRTMDLVWRTFPPGGSDLLAMLAMADWCDDTGGNLFPSICAIAKRIRTSESQARRVVHKLIREGWISVVGNEFGGAPGTTRKYQLNIAKLSATGCTRATPCADATPRTNARDGSHGCEKTPSTDASQTVKQQPSLTVNESRRGTRLPPDWKPSQEETQWASNERPGLDVVKEANKFRDHWKAKAGKDATKMDWTATWRNWIRNARVEFGRGSTGRRESLSDQSARVNGEHDAQEMRHASHR